MGFNKEKLEGLQPVPDGTYKVLFIEFKPDFSKKANEITGKKSTNLNARVKILDHPEFEQDRFLIAPLNEGVETFIQDFVHSFGLEMENQLGDHPDIPGTFDGNQNDPKTWKYSGPLTAKTATWEIGIGDYNGRPVNTLKRFICTVPNCASRFPKITHSKDMAKKG